MNTYPMPDPANDFLAGYVSLIIKSYKTFKGIDLTDSCLSRKEQAKQVFTAPYVLVAHNEGADPVFQYANQKGLALFEMSWHEFTRLNSKYSAEPQNRSAREKLLQEVLAKGYADDYSGVRISKTGRRIQIKSATVWNIMEGDKIRGQAAVFSDYTYL